MSYNLPNPSLIGILLIISTHSGPQLIYKQPPGLTKEPDEDEGEYDQEDIAETESDEYGNYFEYDEDSNMYGTNLYKQWDANHLNYYMGTKKDLISFLDEIETKRKQASMKAVAKKRSQLSKIASNPSTISTTGNSGNDSIFGIEPAYLCEMLAPPKKMCNSRFEIMIDDKIFLGLPVHKYDNGSWRLKGSSKRINRNKEENTHQHEVDNSKSKLNLNMFHLVFIMNPPVIEYNYRIDEMFHYVISRLSLVLRYEQSKNDFISNQVKMILNLKEQFKEKEELESQLLNKSSLCKMIHDCYLSISQSKIANLSVNNKLRSFQIPIKTEFHSLPESSVPFIPGSHLSSTVGLLGTTGLINVGETTRYGEAMNDENEGISEAADDIVYFALLLLDDAESIIRDIKTESSGTLAKFIRMINPTESLLKLSTRSNSLDTLQVKSFAFHLIYWRRARVIQPLSTRSVYFVSPMAPITTNLYTDIREFKKSFPTLPSLPQFLKLLSPQSKKPSQFATVIPSKDHRDIYFEALSWLIRFGYVTQLQTFIWLKISRKIKIKVEEDLENESSSRKRSNITKKLLMGGTDNSSKDPAAESSTDNRIMDQNDDKEENATKQLSNINAEDQEIENIKERLKSTSLGPLVSLEDDDDTILLDPGRATTLERRWINKIIFDECKLSSELTNAFYKLLKYMDGKSPLELLLLKENISRTEIRKLLIAIEDHIISVRHW
ncbi:predicted protein [Scheffersomyces stipitis CBS 6054]|uniref:Nitrogen permease regulator 3 n=1 Tax=Scheffersomyces stipitis (strain ATCC 58785 / CBS 6054 / NBRC 10063 / NRRL Y-11545) TaxID=322104 RepID=NPR3_PICST|nr:predicted protein [Scheffersomyces stipitis CBS 6054]A3LYV8.2 RecName: Full=Nitrogen permease regulator 3; AltName: Full=Required for meiotic nuclear division protein 11; Flags: Precursor [Scheffersomyces stipitis CBS 6054]ABN68047.2 predicted protein [Scheffersomyces stipitis CBS 6054]